MAIESEFLRQYANEGEEEESDIDSPFLQGFAKYETETPEGESAPENTEAEEEEEEEEEDNDIMFDSPEEEAEIRRHLPGLGRSNHRDYLRSGSRSFTDDIVKKESGGNYRATNPNSTATGKYQFLWGTAPGRGWGDKIKANTGVRSREEFLNNPEAQDKFYNDYYLPNELMPAVKRLKAKGAKYDTNTLAKLVHFRGEQGAEDYLSGKVGDKPEAYNSSISSYIKQTGGYAQAGVNPALGMKNYIGYSPVEKNSYMQGYGASGVQYSPTDMATGWFKDNQLKSSIPVSPQTAVSDSNYFESHQFNPKIETSAVKGPITTGVPVADAVMKGVDQFDGQIAGYLNTFKTISDGAEKLEGVVGKGVSGAATAVTSFLGQRDNENKYYKMLEELYSENKSQYKNQGDNQNLSKSFLL
jgi:hypothetical protein